MGTVRAVIHASFCLPISRVPFSLILLSLNGSRRCLLCPEREASDSSHFLTSFAQKVRRGSYTRGLTACDRGDWKANGADEIATEKDPWCSNDWLRAGKRAMCVSVC